ncbi:hypothetical protein CC1G_06644 [Coprinopsis cinerea okayama7|uniref:Uncharacterized protein n=1 Tax=Coprinopsis cinerea (strain Okayama-7 / 130 / ATCC MYA-4618 / FGSC 9003) TaxID=240176 RepID=A8P7V0_COPC7|nr:hypothetical protein CC1G_06644 [Coprinopsis cinerea okayama7\|eukprot:XP_001839431.2 hypothetical protein CC1G_06644 [Coprinopsis cinerea okayama7\
MDVDLAIYVLTLHVFVRDGTIYFLVIFLANLMNTIIYFTAPEDLKAIGASFSQLITAAMVSRLVLNLRSLSTFEHFDSYIHETEIHGHHSQLRSGRSGIVVARDNFMTRTLNDLGDGEEEGDSLDGRGMELEVRVDNVVLRTVEGGGGEGEGEKARVEVVQMPVLPVRRREPVGSDSDAERGGLASTSTTEDKAPVAL